MQTIYREDDPNSSINSNQIDQEASLEMENQAISSPSAKQGGQYKSMIAIGLISVLATALIVLGLSNLYLNQEDTVHGSKISFMNVDIENQVQPTMLASDQECTKRQLIQPNGDCKTCDDYKTPDEDRKECIFPTCDKPEEVAFIDGSCMKCFPYTQPNPTKVGCTYPTCGERQQIGFSGFCQDCPDFQRSINSKISCEEPICKERFKVILDGTCEECPEYQVTTDDLRGCERPKCDVMQKITSDGQCQQCPDYHRTFDDKLKCEMPKCSEREEMMKDGTCMTCPAYERAIEGGKGCAIPVCEGRQMVLPDATCQECPPFTNVDWSGLLCEAPTCGEREKHTINGGCEQCDDYKRVLCEDEQSCDLRQCKEPICADRQKINPDGSCETCQPFTTVHIPENFGDGQLLPEGTGGIDAMLNLNLFGSKECVAPKCGDRQKITTDGSCQVCDPFTIVDEDGRSCVMPECSFNQYVDIDGTCEDCQPYTQVSKDRLQCLVPECTSRQTIGITGTCRDCRPFTLPNSSQRSCISPVCSERQKVLPSGDCRVCDDYTIVSQDGRTCEPPVCSENQITLANGLCKECDKFTVVSKDGKTCIKPECVDREFITKDGTCQQCPAYLITASDKMSCVHVVCPDENDSINADGECHDFDETLEKRHDDLIKKSVEVGKVVVDMAQKLDELTAELNKVKQNKTMYKNQYKSEKELTKQLEEENSSCVNTLGERSDQMNALLGRCDVQGQQFTQEKQKVNSLRRDLLTCQRNKQRSDSTSSKCNMEKVECQSKLRETQKNLENYSAEKERAQIARFDECEDSYTDLQKELKEQDRQTQKYKVMLYEKMNDYKEMENVYITKYDKQERNQEALMTDIRLKATETQQQQQKIYMAIKSDLQTCRLEKEAATPRKSVEGQYYRGYEMTQGKCRKPDKVSYGKNDNYNVVNTRYSVNTEQGCADRCNADSRCDAWQFYQLDPGAYDNCNIWTEPGYSGNDSNSSKCYTKSLTGISSNISSSSSSNVQRGVESCSKHDKDCIECDNNFEVAGCTKCGTGFWMLGGVCYKTVGGWGR